MPKGNGDIINYSNQACGFASQEHGECRKAMETSDLVVNWTTFVARQEHGECRKAMETTLY